MFVFVLQTVLLVLIAFVLGAVIGCVLGTQQGGVERTELPPKTVPKAATPTAASASTAEASTAMREPDVEGGPGKPVRSAKSSRRTRSTPATSRTAVSENTVAVPAPRDDLKKIAGIGRQNEARLNALGITRFEQIAKWTKKDVEAWGVRLSFPGRIEREKWVAQAKRLTEGEVTDFAKRVAAGGVESSTGKGSVGDTGKKPRLLKAARKSGADNLTLITGIGNAIEKKLFSIGIFHFDQIARWSPAEAKWIGGAIGFPGRVEREKWIAEAAILAGGGTTDHAERVEEGRIRTSRISTRSELESRNDKKS